MYDVLRLKVSRTAHLIYCRIAVIHLVILQELTYLLLDHENLVT